MNQTGSLFARLTLCAIVVVAALGLAVTSCEHIEIPSLKDNPIKDANLTLHISTVTQTTFPNTTGTTRTGTLADVCTRLSFIVFDAATGAKIQTVNQTATDESFGTASLKLEAGNYKVVAVGHSGKGNVTVKSPEEISFPDNKMTDTFCACMTVEVGEEPKEATLKMERCVAMVRLILTDETLPEKFTEMEIYYTGGSSTLNAVTGFGAKSSRQTEVRQAANATTDSDGNMVMEVYTIPHETDDLLNYKATAKDAEGNSIVIREWTNLPVTLGYITELKGRFFTVSVPETAMSVSVNAVWKGTETIEF